MLRQLRQTRKGQLVTAHLSWSKELGEFLEKNGFRTFLIVRDLRDIALSASFCIAQKDKAHRLHTYFQISLSDAQIKDITENTFFTGARTFRKGQIGGWRAHFTEKHKKAFKETAGEALIKMGYGNDLDW
ncbi:MAG: hypothetical protein BA863_19550 [Desulfovibrio sp. S3730MH75]|nr:MAG: hypothetical protein BA863_19550 [Desulfovibrio sp. S3730MH75]